jgi:hypothetical protein
MSIDPGSAGSKVRGRHAASSSILRTPNEATWKFMWQSPGPSPLKTASLWCTGSIRMRHAASPIQSDTFVLKVPDQNR